MLKELPHRFRMSGPSVPDHWPMVRESMVEFAAQGKAYLVTPGGAVLDAVAIAGLDYWEAAGCEIEVWDSDLMLALDGYATSGGKTWPVR